jgi:shikimate kinase
MGSGKTTAARQLGDISGLRFCDMDNEIVLREGKTISMIFAENGENYFRKKERELLEEICKTSRQIIATGGGTPCYYDNMELMNRNGLTVYLQCSVEELFSWLNNNKKERPLLKDKTDKELKEYISQELAHREGFYQQSQIVVNAYEITLSELWEIIKSSPNCK